MVAGRFENTLFRSPLRLRRLPTCVRGRVRRVHQPAHIQHQAHQRQRLHRVRQLRHFEVVSSLGLRDKVFLRGLQRLSVLGGG